MLEVFVIILIFFIFCDRIYMNYHICTNNRQRNIIFVQVTQRFVSSMIQLYRKKMMISTKCPWQSAYETYMLTQKCEFPAIIPGTLCGTHWRRKCYISGYLGLIIRNSYLPCYCSAQQLLFSVLYKKNCKQWYKIIRAIVTD